MRKIATLLLTACLASSVMAQTQPQVKDPFIIATKENVAAANAAALNSVRMSALREFALTKGLADGRQQKFQEIHQYFEINKRVLDALYQVDHLYMQPRKRQIVKDLTGRETSRMENDNAFNGFLIQPPIVLKGQDIMQIANGGQRMESSNIRYAIASNALFVANPIYWQTFLVAPEDLMSQAPADDPLLQPRDEAERAVMLSFYKVGLLEGQSQAVSEVETRTKTLTTMITGMSFGRVLMDKSILKEPEVSTQYVPVSGNKTLLTLNTNAAYISVPSGFELDPSKYKVIIHQANPFAKE
jgi:hypothetical protein